MPADPAALPAWLAALEARAPDLVAPFAALAEGRPLEVRRGIRARAGEGSAARILPQHATLTTPEAAPARTAATLTAATARTAATLTTPEADRP